MTILITIAVFKDYGITTITGKNQKEVIEILKKQQDFITSYNLTIESNDIQHDIQTT